MQGIEKVLIQLRMDFLAETEQLIPEYEKLGFVKEWHSKFSGNLIGLLTPDQIATFRTFPEIASIQRLFSTTLMTSNFNYQKL